MKVNYKYFVDELKKHKYIMFPIIMLIIVPILLMCVLGFEYSTFPVDNIPTIIVNHDTSDTIQTLENNIANNDTFKIVCRSQNDNDIKEYIDEGNAYVGILIPKDFTEDLYNMKEPKIMVFYDGSVTSSLSGIKSKVSEILNTIKTGYLMTIAEGKLGASPNNVKSVVSPIQYEYRLMGNPQKNTGMFLIEGVVLTAIQIATASVGASISEDKNMIKLILKGLIIGLIGTLTCVICMIIATLKFSIPYRGDIFAGILLGLFCNTGMAFVGILLNQFTNGNKSAAVSACSAISFTMLLSGYTVPIVSMPKVFSKIEYYVPNSHFIIVVRQIALLGYNMTEVIPHIIWQIKFLFLMITIVIIAFYLRKYLINIRKNKEGVIYED